MCLASLCKQGLSRASLRAFKGVLLSCLLFHAVQGLDMSHLEQPSMTCPTGTYLHRL